MSAEPLTPTLEPVTEEPPELETETPTVTLPQAWRFPVSRNALLALGGLAVIAIIPALWNVLGFYGGAYALIYAMIGLSVTVVTGYGGVISLMPYSFAGIGAVVTALAMSQWGWPFWLCIPLAAAATIPISFVAGAVSVRLRGLYMAIATLTMAQLLGNTFFQWKSVTNGQDGWLVSRPALFASDGWFYVLCLIAALVMVGMVEGLRTSRTGRAMLAVRDNEREAQALGINVYKTRLAALVIGGMMAGVGGAFLAMLLQSVVADPAFLSPYTDATSILLVTLVVVGGIDRAWGAFFGALIFVIQQQVFAGAQFFGAFVGIYSALLLIILLLFRPGGLLQVARQDYLELIKRRPALGIALVTGVLLLNGGVAYLFVRLS